MGKHLLMGRVKRKETGFKQESIHSPSIKPSCSRLSSHPSLLISSQILTSLWRLRQQIPKEDRKEPLASPEGREQCVFFCWGVAHLCSSSKSAMIRSNSPRSSLSTDFKIWAGLCGWLMGDSPPSVWQYCWMRACSSSLGRQRRETAAHIWVVRSLSTEVKTVMPGLVAGPGCLRTLRLHDIPLKTQAGHSKLVYDEFNISKHECYHLWFSQSPESCSRLKRK